MTMAKPTYKLRTVRNGSDGRDFQQLMTGDGKVVSDVVSIRTLQVSPDGQTASVRVEMNLTNVPVEEHDNSETARASGTPAQDAPKSPRSSGTPAQGEPTLDDAGAKDK